MGNCWLAKESTYTIEELRQYDAFLDAVRVAQTIRADAKTQGEQIGLKKGKIENSIAVAREMLIDGMPIDKIAKFTKLPVDQITALATKVAQQEAEI